MTEKYDVIIAGAGHAGAQTAINLRQAKFDGSIALIGNEPFLPYERPPLSKDYLAGEKPFERILLRPEEFWNERNIDLLLGKRVAKLTAQEKTVALADDRIIGFDKLVWAAGGSARMLDCPGSEATNIFAVRHRADVDAIQKLLPHVERVAIVGGGYIGLEVAAVMRKMGKSVCVIEALDRVLSRVAGPALSRFYEEEHRRQGVDLRLDAKVEQFITDDNGKATSLICDNGDMVPADLFIVGIGIIPETGPLMAEGAAGGNGVDVDEFCRTSLTDIYAIGDCASHANAFANGRQIRLESVQNANDQAKVAAQHIVGEPLAYHAIPWFWSNQYDLRLQTVGLSIDYDTEILRGDPATRQFSTIYLRGGKVIALDCVNSTKDYVQGRKLVLDGAILDQAELADPARPLKEVSIA